MERENVIEACCQIFNCFEKGDTFDGEKTLLSYLTWITGPGHDAISAILQKEESKPNEKHPADMLTDDVWMPLAYAGFGIGFTLGSLCECANPEITKWIEEVRRAIKEAAIFPVVPKAREEKVLRIIKNQMGRRNPDQAEKKADETGEIDVLEVIEHLQDLVDRERATVSILMVATTGTDAMDPEDIQTVMTDCNERMTEVFDSLDNLYKTVGAKIK